MCHLNGDCNGITSSRTSRTTSGASTSDDGGLGPSFEESITYSPGYWLSTRTSRVVVALICAVCAAISVSRCRGCLSGGMCWWEWAAAGGISRGRNVSKLSLKMDSFVPCETSDTRRSWPRHLTSFNGKLKEGQKSSRRKAKREPDVGLESSDVAGDGFGEDNTRDRADGGKSGARRRRKSRGNIGSTVRQQQERKAESGWALFLSRSGLTSRGGAKEEEEKEADRVGQDKTGTQRKRRAFQALWGRIIQKLGGSGGGVRIGFGKGKRKAGEEGEAEIRRAKLLKELKETVEERYGRELWARAKASRHELDDAQLLRYLEMAFWTMECMGQHLPDAVASTVHWREQARPHLVTNQEVAEEAMYGKMYVRGHDREGRPIIHYRPGLEKSFDTEKGLNLLFYTLERAKNLLPKGQTQFAVVADCSGFGPSKTPPLPMLKTAFVTMQRHYPMRLGYVMIVNAGAPIAFLWKIISAVLDERTKEKITFLPKREAEARLTRLIDPDYLPATLPGGTDSFAYTNEEYLL